MAVLWQQTLAYSAWAAGGTTGVKKNVTKAGKRYLKGVTSKSLARKAASRAGWKVTGAAAAGTAAGQGVNWAISFWYDPIAPMYELIPLGNAPPLREPEVDLFITDLLHDLEIDLLECEEILSDTQMQFVLASAESLWTGTRLVGNLMRGAVAATQGNNETLASFVRLGEVQLKEYIASLGAVAKTAAATDVAAELGSLQKQDYIDFVSACKRQGQEALPPYEGHMIQKLFNLAGARPPFEDFRDEVADWVATEGPAEYELAAFDKHGGSLSFADLIAGSLDWYWNRIELSESPILPRKGVLPS